MLTGYKWRKNSRRKGGGKKKRRRRKGRADSIVERKNREGER